MPFISKQTHAYPMSTAEEPRPPKIVANSKRIDNRFPTLSFTIYTGGLPFEVLLTTDRGQFSPSQTARRSVTTWYSSRQDSGIIRALGNESIYLVPTAVLRSFASAQPHPTAIYYTVIAYQGMDGSGPVFAQPPETLATSAPMVTLASDFRAQTLATIMGISSEKLSVVKSPSAASQSREDDAVEGEDGYDPEGSEFPLPGPAAASLSSRGDPFMGDTSDLAYNYDDGWGTGESAAAARAVYDGPSSSLADFAYSDGFEEQLGDINGWAQPESAAPGMAEPTQLEDDEDEYSDDDGYEEIGSEYPAIQSQAASSYGDEADNWMGRFSSSHALDEPQTAPDAGVGSAPAPAELTPAARRDILEQIIHYEAGRNNPYAAINADGEYEGRFPGHEAAGRYHIGLSYGIVQFTQDSGNLGRLLSMMQRRSPDAFNEIFGEQAGEMLRVTNAPGPSSKDSPGGRSARVQPVDGADLWVEPWRSRFIRAAAEPEYQAAQLQLASDLFIDPMLRFAGWLGLDTDRALAMVVDRAVHMGVGGARSWIIGVVGPVQSVAQRQQALSALGASDLHGFQAMHPELDQDGEWGPMTHAAMVASLRQLGGSSPVPVPTRDQMMDAMVRRASGTAFTNRVAGLRGSSEFQDTVYQLI